MPCPCWLSVLLLFFARFFGVVSPAEYHSDARYTAASSAIAPLFHPFNADAWFWALVGAPPRPPPRFTPPCCCHHHAAPETLTTPPLVLPPHAPPLLRPIRDGPEALHHGYPPVHRPRNQRPGLHGARLRLRLPPRLPADAPVRALALRHRARPACLCLVLCCGLCPTTTLARMSCEKV